MVEPEVYLASTFHVDGNYFILAWLAANFMLLFSVYCSEELMEDSGHN